jgi:hypothetical protein
MKNQYQRSEANRDSPGKCLIGISILGDLITKLVITV